MRLPLLLVLLFVAVNINAQNILSNGSFEQYTICPTGLSQADRCVGWRQYTNATSDFFHDCNAGYIPVAYIGWQYPAHGDAYMGFYTFSNTSSTNMWKEYVATTIPPLNIGGTYEVSMSVSLANNATMACNDLGMFFYDNGPTSINTGNSIGTPQVWFTSQGPITDTQNWVRVTQVFTADSAYDNIVIGGFKNWSAIVPSDTTRMRPTGFTSYYYVDSVVIKLINGLEISVTDSLLCIGDSVIVPFTAYSFQSPNTFSLQLSDAFGSFTSPITLTTINGNASGTFRTILPNSITAGTGYQLRIVASNPAKTVVSPVTIDIGQSMPVKPVATGRSIACGGEPLQLNATTPSTGVTWEWSGPAGFSANMQNPIVPNFAAANAGRYIVTARNIGCEAKDTLNVTYQAPLIPVTATNSSPVCDGANVNLYTTPSTSGVTYSWTGPNSYNSSVQNPVLTGATTGMGGNYTVTATLNGCTVENTTTVIVNPIPVATASTAGPACAGSMLNLIATSNLTGSTYQWSGPGGFSSTQQSPAISGATMANNGTYTVIASKNGCNSAPATTQATVLLTPAMPTASNTGPTCSGSSVTLKASSPTTGVSYSWTGPGFSSNTQNPTIANTSMANAGVYTVTATLGSCTSAPAHTTLSITERPTVGAYVSPNDTVCSNASPFFQAFPKNQGNTPQYQWYRNNQPIPGATQTMYTATGLNNGDVIKFVVLAAGTACTDPVNSNDIPMTIIPVITNPKVTIVTEPAMPVSPWQTVVFNAKIDHIGSKTTYQWRLNGVDVFGANAASWSTFNLRAGDKVTVMVHTNNPCAEIDSALSDALTIQHKTSIANTDNKSAISVYPNPNNGNFTIEGINTNTVVKLDIINTLGQSVYSKELKANNGKINLSAPELAPGTYLLKLSYAGEQQTIKFNIE
jgi:hypothetical protein